MSGQDRVHWEERYQSREAAQLVAAELPAVFAPFENEFPTEGRALELACGLGSASVWLARRGMDVWGVDISATAIRRARDLATRSGVSDRCRFDVVDLDLGLPAGPHVDTIVCHRFRAPHLDQSIIKRLAPGGLLAISALSVVGAGPGRFRVAPGELATAFAGLGVIAEGEGDGEAWLLARKPVLA
ncbi:bifunctional 2-polyprenyl-6-hydroxyphenol methylase/3-demethylubiquinol 3-O-methyltransferase UbiG [Mycobacterium sp. 852014-52144_SCH5372336]|uniref:class I SAM-dependent methyltransferase n=1 Tax=Mycobacterium sp. 852014-52144_SCH5372336 TaxID=1834115 RepID=UPI0007FB7E7D|nr:class I SAM-dependent methyltransferase [Mycobacterium sp. 852014-52144_SCH5372336]OBB77134.1 SAM-dependent methyltransferase [Mycobacterium sp. 852014-52144_SCH5372336]